MLLHFEFPDGSNPYIVINDRELFRMICKYDFYQTGTLFFSVIGEKKEVYPFTGVKTYAEKKEALRDFAKDYQNYFSCFNYSMRDIINFSAFFEEYGKRYGLIKEFRENGII